MKKIIAGIFGLIFLSALFSPAFADEDKKIRLWKEYVSGSGGSVVNQGSFGSGIEYAFFHDDYNHDVTVTAELFDDGTTYNASKLVMPVMANYRWFVGPKAFQGVYLSGGIGEMIPFGYDHGGGAFAWQGGIGYAASQKFAFELRYLGRRAQTVNNLGNNYTLSNTFLSAMISYTFF